MYVYKKAQAVPFLALWLIFSKILGLYLDTLIIDYTICRTLRK